MTKDLNWKELDYDKQAKKALQLARKIKAKVMKMRRKW